MNLGAGVMKMVEENYSPNTIRERIKDIFVPRFQQVLELSFGRRGH